MDELEGVNDVEREQAVMREGPPVRAVLEHVAVDAVVARDRQQRRPLIDGYTRVIGLHELRPIDAASIDLHDIGNASDTVADQPREDPPFALGPVSEISVGSVEKALRIASSLPWSHRLAVDLDMLAGHHLEAAAPEYAIDLLGGHGSRVRDEVCPLKDDSADATTRPVS